MLYWPNVLLPDFSRFKGIWTISVIIPLCIPHSGLKATNQTVKLCFTDSSCEQLPNASLIPKYCSTLCHPVAFSENGRSFAYKQKF